MILFIYPNFGNKKKLRIDIVFKFSNLSFIYPNKKLYIYDFLFFMLHILDKIQSYL